MAFTRADYEKAAAVIRNRTDLPVKVGLVLGSGLNVLADVLEDRVEIPYKDIPGFPQSTVEGHAGELVLGRLEGVPAITQKGRAHLYEGYSAQQITFPIRVMQMLGVNTLILTNAAGGLNTSFRVGDVMLIVDHINFVGMGGNNPLMGPNDPSLGVRFVGLAQTYDRHLRAQAVNVAAENNINLQQGVYVCLSGPQFESPAEIRMLRTIGGDAVGMSTVHEVLVGRHAGMRVLAFSGITNECIDQIDTELETNHEEVLDASRILVPKLETILRGVLRSLQ
ncbi:MAG: purine-nucleoside phosphorylase [Chloroflexi bacterium]|uniref:purine-nucleoside phosphorylase n=1 Tax=Candidatus Flexifilum breve TaxID=3140694 RepID=UPI003134B6F2|nr:purine-nucleoside phosphorylase [Chloroflexota bacterium]